MSNLQEKYDLELTNKDDIIADLQNRLDTALRNDDFKEKYEHLGENLEFAWVKKSQCVRGWNKLHNKRLKWYILETENEKLKNQLREQQDKNKTLLEDINKKPVEVPTTIDNSRHDL